ncbi:hypothetical protein ACQEU3_08495 [Spirillospora sp. CA-253888]
MVDSWVVGGPVWSCPHGHGVFLTEHNVAHLGLHVEDRVEPLRGTYLSKGDLFAFLSEGGPLTFEILPFPERAGASGEDADPTPGRPCPVDEDHGDMDEESLITEEDDEAPLSDALRCPVCDGCFFPPNTLRLWLVDMGRSFGTIRAPATEHVHSWTTSEKARRVGPYDYREERHCRSCGASEQSDNILGPDDPLFMSHE